MLKLIQIEFLKLRRRRLIWLMLSAAVVMPFFALLYFHYFGATGVEPLLFYKWSAFSYTPIIILPFVLGIFCMMLLHEENLHDILKQLWIVPIGKMGYFFSKFFIVMIYSNCFMLVTAAASVLCSTLPGYVAFEWGSVLYLLEKCLEISVFTAFATLPILAVAASQKGYIFPVCVTLVYVFSNFILMPVNMYMHPISCMAVIIMRNRDIPGLAAAQEINIPLALLSICIWDIAGVSLANLALRRK